MQNWLRIEVLNIGRYGICRWHMPCISQIWAYKKETKLDDLREESKRVGLQINPLKTEEISANTIINRVFKLNGEEIKKSPDFCYLARGWFSKLRKVWLSPSIRKETKIKIFNACVKSVLLYGCETWLVTSEIRRKIQTFVNRCLRYILRIWWLKIISNKDLWRATGQEDINLEIKKI